MRAGFIAALARALRLAMAIPNAGPGTGTPNRPLRDGVPSTGSGLPGSSDAGRWRARNGGRAKPAKASFEIPSLNGIRGLAVTIVFMAHAGIALAPGPLGVTIFFFLSGYLITTLLRIEYDRAGTIDFRAFYLRRAFRLLPPLYIVLVAVDLLTLAGAFEYRHLRLGAVLSQMFFLSNYQILSAGWDGAATGRAPGTGGLWSLAVEEHFYLLFPLAYLLLRRHISSPRRQVAVLGAACAAVLLWRCVLILGLHASFDRTYAASDTRIDSILFGCMLGILGNPVLDRKDAAQSRPLGSVWAPVFAGLGVAAIVIVYPWHGDVGPALFRSKSVSGTVQYTVQGLALIPVFIVAVRYADSGMFKLLNHPAAVFVGITSYSIYISHEIIIALVHAHVPGGRFVHALLYVCLTLLFAWGMYRLVERPFARVRKRLSRTGAGPGNADTVTRERRALLRPRAGGS